MIARTALASLLILAAGALPSAAQPTVVATGEGQVGATPGAGDQVIGNRFESIRGQPGELLLGGILVFGGGGIVPPPETSFVTDTFHGPGSPGPVAAFADSFDQVFKTPAASARSRNAAADGDFVAFSFAVDGSQPQTMAVRLVTFDETGSNLFDITLDDIETFPDPAFNETGVAVDEQGRATVVYTDLPAAAPAQVIARRYDAAGNPIGGDIPVATNRALVDVALLDPAGDRLVVVHSDFTDIRGNVVDVSGPTPQVLPPFPISTTPAFSNVNPSVAADPATGAFVVAWENVTAAQGDPINIRARRFDAQGNPVGDDFIVNTTTADAQGQPAVAVGPGGDAVVVWASDPPVAGDELDIFAQAYDASGQPIGGEIKVNTVTPGVQDRPAVRFLPEPDGQGRDQFTVVWRDVADAEGNGASGTGTGYRCFSIDDGALPPPEEIFTDGFESGDTSSWSTTRP